MEALKWGFVGIDTAAQPRHYSEECAGKAIRSILQGGSFTRGDVFIQTKYTPPVGQDTDSSPFSFELSIADQVRTSVYASLRHLTDATAEGNYLDCVLLHSPLKTYSDTLEAWTALEEFVPNRIRHLGISNISLPILEWLYEVAVVKPVVVQNRFYAKTNYDVEIRGFCKEKEIVYQAYWILKKNPDLLASDPVQTLAVVLRVQEHAALYCLLISLGGLVVLNGTTKVARMRDDLHGLRTFERWSSEADNHELWSAILCQFKALIGEV